MKTKAILKQNPFSEEIRVIDLSGTERLFSNLYSLSKIVDEKPEAFCDAAIAMSHIIKLISLTNKDMMSLLKKKYNV